MSDTQVSDGRFSLRRVIGRTFAVIRRDWLTIVLVCVLAYTAETAVIIGAEMAQVGLIPTTMDGGNLRSVLTGLIVLRLIRLVTHAFLAGALTHLAVPNGERGNRLGRSLRNGVRLLLPLLPLYFVFCVAILGASLLLIVPGILLLTAWFVALPVRATEGGSLQAALSRSASLTKGRRWDMFALLLIVLTAAYAFGRAPGQLIVFGPSWTFAGYGVYGTLLSVVISSVLGAVTAVGTAVTYVELRHTTAGALPYQVADVFE